MTDTRSARYFLGANTPFGFKSYFDRAFSICEDWNIFIIKGGPGTGKSTLMKRICAEAAQRELFCEHIYCSSDPASLDGVIIPELHTAVFDGTAPHVMEPSCPGVCENIINLGAAWSKARLRSMRAEISECMRQCSAHHAQAVRFLACADAFRRNTAELAAYSADSQRIEHTAERLISKYISRTTSGKSKEQQRLLSAVTPHGITVFSDTAEQLCDTVITIKDRFFTPSAILMEALHRKLSARGCDITLCFCSQSPERIEHIIIPEQRIAFSVCSDIHELNGTERSIHTERFMNSAVVSESRQQINHNKKCILEFTELASAEMRRAKAVHDKLEQYYISAMDFDAAEDIIQNTCREIFGY